MKHTIRPTRRLLVVGLALAWIPASMGLIAFLVPLIEVQGFRVTELRKLALPGLGLLLIGSIASTLHFYSIRYEIDDDYLIAC